MQTLLEEYLNEITIHLCRLPGKRRNEELREMRQHLQNAVIVNQEFGQSEAEAVANAIEQFGHPREIGNSLIRAWQRDRDFDRWSFWGALACIFPALFYLPCVQSSWLEKIIFALAHQFSSEDHPVFVPMIVSVVLAVMVGLGIGWIFARRAVTGVAIGTLLWLLVQILVFPTMLHVPMRDIPDYVGPWVSQLAIASALTILSAWAASHWRNRKRLRGTSRPRPARW